MLINDVADIILDRFEIGEMVEIPDQEGHGSSGFSISRSKTLRKKFMNQKKKKSKQNINCI